MRRPPPLSQLPRYPLAGGLALAAIAVSVTWWAGRDVSYLTMDLRWWPWQPWRLVSSALPHVNFIHLAFNVYWLWVFGTVLEARWGPLRTAGVVAVLAAGSAAAEFAFAVGGVGLSGVGYGLFALLWVLGREDPAFAGVVDRPTVQLFVAWFVLCIVMSYSGGPQIANVAHAAGAGLGGVLGLAVVRRGAARHLLAGGLAASLLLLGVLASVARPYVNRSADVHGDYAYAAWQEQRAGHDAEAVRLYRIAIAHGPNDPDNWFNLAISLQRLERLGEAVQAYQMAVKLDPGNVEFRNALIGLEAWLAIRPAAAPKAGDPRPGESPPRVEAPK